MAKATGLPERLSGEHNSVWGDLEETVGNGVGAGAVAFADHVLEMLTVVIGTREEHERIAAGDCGKDRAPEMGLEVAEQMRVEQPRGLDGNRPLARNGEQVFAVGGPGPGQIESADLLQVEHCLSVQGLWVQIPAFEVGIEDKAERFGGIDRVANDEIRQPGRRGELLLTGHHRARMVGAGLCVECRVDERSRANQRIDQLLN